MKLEVSRTVSRQTLRDNVKNTSIEEYYRHFIFLPFSDSLLKPLNDRFQGKTKDATEFDTKQQ